MGLKTSGELSLPSAAPAAKDLIRLNPMKYSKISTQCTVSRNARTDSRSCKGVCVCFCYHAMIFLFFVVLLCTLISDEKYKFYFIYLHAPHIKYEYDHGDPTTPHADSLLSMEIRRKFLCCRPHLFLLHICQQFVCTKQSALKSQ